MRNSMHKDNRKRLFVLEKDYTKREDLQVKIQIGNTCERD
jgi:ribonuclease PH